MPTYPAKLDLIDHNNRTVTLVTKSRGQWDPITVSPAVNMSDLSCGQFYGWTINNGAIDRVEALPDRAPSPNGNGYVPRAQNTGAQPQNPSSAPTRDHKVDGIRLTMCGLANQYTAHHGAPPLGEAVYQLRMSAEEIWNSAQTAVPGQQAQFKNEPQEPNDDIPF